MCSATPVSVHICFDEVMSGSDAAVKFSNLYQKRSPLFNGFR